MATTLLVCPIDGMLPAANATGVPTYADAVASGSTVIGSATATGINVTTGSSFAVGQWVQIPSKSSEKMQITGISSNTLTVTRGAGAVATYAASDVVLTGLDFNGQPAHCPLCGSGMSAVDATKVTTLTGVAAGSQHPADVDVAYGTNADSVLAQQGTAYTSTGTIKYPVIPKAKNTSPGYWTAVPAGTGSAGGPESVGQPTTWTTAAGSVNRGDTNITPESDNSTVGP